MYSSFERCKFVISSCRNAGTHMHAHTHNLSLQQQRMIYLAMSWRKWILNQQSFCKWLIHIPSYGHLLTLQMEKWWPILRYHTLTVRMDIISTQGGPNNITGDGREVSEDGNPGTGFKHQWKWSLRWVFLAWISHWLGPIPFGALTALTFCWASLPLPMWVSVCARACIFVCLCIRVHTYMCV